MTEALWQILSLKYDRRPHYTWPAVLLDDDGQQLRLRSVLGGTLIHFTRGFEELTRRPSDLYFWRSRWYNVFENFHEDGTFRSLYCNVAMPPFITDHTINFVDLDLDVQFWADGTYRVLDRDEYEAHRVQLGYPDWVQQHAEGAVDEIIAAAEAREGPFGVLPAGLLARKPQ